MLSEYHTPKGRLFIPTELRDRPTDVTPDSLMRSESGYFTTVRRCLHLGSVMLRRAGVLCAMLSISRPSGEADEQMMLPSLYLPYVAPDGTQMVMVEPVVVHPSQVRELISTRRIPTVLKNILKEMTEVQNIIRDFRQKRLPILSPLTGASARDAPVVVALSGGADLGGAACRACRPGLRLPGGALQLPPARARSMRDMRHAASVCEALSIRRCM